jgi:outer membrane protein OmpA-like peptidoglycan-associated protein
MSRRPSPRRLDGVAATAILAVILSAAGATDAHADGRARASRWGFGLDAGVHKLIEGEWDYSTFDAVYGVRLVRGLGPQWQLSGDFRFGYVRSGAAFPEDTVGWSRASGAPYYTALYQPALTLRHRFSPDARVTPTLGLGLGLTSWHVMDQDGQDVGWFPKGESVSGFDTNGDAVLLEGTELTIALELGLDVALSGSLDLNLAARYAMMPGNDVDNVGLSDLWGADHVDANTAVTGASIGLTWWFGSGDRDGDGVPDDRDACPDQPEDPDGWNDLDGCPDEDNDRDGIPDAEDACPGVAEDQDGFQDEDGCPEADNDRDGIPDGRDRCPDVPEDVDGDADQDGCPDLDTDGDGVDDEIDQCPGTPPDSLVDENGCVVVVPNGADAEIHLSPAAEVVALEGVTFASGSAQLTADAQVYLEDIAAWLASEPDGRYEIRGHTDSAGDPERNRSLSARRAESVRQALIDLGLPAASLTAVGLGADHPIADNSTATGRAQNRRVEIVRLP